MVVRRATKEDLQCIMDIIEDARTYMREAGIDQWQNGYPNEEIIAHDIKKNESYVIENNKIIVGTAVISFFKEIHYEQIRDGQWINQKDYAVIHRVAVASEYKGKGIAGRLIDEAQNMSRGKVHSLRIDTHQDNKSMQQLILKCGFSYCGRINIEDGSERMCFEKLIE